MCNLRKTIFLISICTFQGFAEGGAPMLTDGPGTPGDGYWEINLAYTGNLRHEVHRYEEPIVDVNYGFGESIQLKIESSYIGLRTQDQFLHGTGNTKAGVKWRFYDDDNLQISTYPQFGFSPVRSHIDNALSDYDKLYVLPLEITKRFDLFWLTAEGGYMWMKNAKDQIKYGLLGGYDITPKCTLMIELYGNSNSDGSEKTRIANFGLTYAVIRNIALLLSIGRELETPEPDRGTLFYSGIQFKF